MTDLATPDIRILHTVAEMKQAETVLARVWDASAVPLAASVIRALAHSGNYVAGAFDPLRPEEMVGCLIGFFGPPRNRCLHSHIAGVHPSFANRGVGTALKRHQRAWCVENGATSMTWTFDPAIRRNAYFNIGKLGVTVEEYLEDFYGIMDDTLNLGSPTDRLFVRWDLLVGEEGAESAGGDGAPRDGSAPESAVVLAVDPAGAPAVAPDDPAASTVCIQVPADMEALRASDPALAADWRLAIRAALARYVRDPDWSVAGFSKEGFYIVQKNITDGEARS